MEKNKLRLNICGTDYVIISEDSEEYMYLVGKEVDEKMRNILDNNDKISVTMAAVLTALKYCDLSKKSEENADNLRVQIKDYLEDSSKSRMEADEARREIERMKREIQMLRMRLAERDTNVSGNQKLSKKSNYESCPPISKSQTNSNQSESNDNKEENKAENEILNFFLDKTGE